MPRAAPLCRLARKLRCAHRRSGQRRGMPIDTSRSRSSSTSRAETCSACRAHFRPRIACCRAPARLPTFVLNCCMLFLDGLALRYHLPFASKVMWSERVPKKVEAFLPGVLQRGLGLVDGQPESGHHTSRPLQSRVRIPTAENDKVIGIGDDLRRERFERPVSRQCFRNRFSRSWREVVDLIRR